MTTTYNIPTLTKEELQIAINKNREEINKFLHSNLPPDIIQFIIQRLSNTNTRHINQIKELNK